jgi:hypothetical protein
VEGSGVSFEDGWVHAVRKEKRRMGRRKRSFVITHRFYAGKERGERGRK